MAQFVPEGIPRYDQSLLAYLAKNFNKIREAIAELDRNVSLKPVMHTIDTNENTASATYVDLATVGPTVSLRTGKSVCIISSFLGENNGADQGGVMNVDITGASTFGPQTAWETVGLYSAANRNASACSLIHINALTPGVNQFRAKYRAHWGGTASFKNRKMIVFPIKD